MSAIPFDHSDQADLPGEEGAGPGMTGPPASEESRVAGSPVVVRRHAGIAALVGAAASAVAIAYLWRASQTAALLDWSLFAAMALIGGYYLASFVDSRTPLLVADDLGVRIRLGHEWRGLPWDAIAQVVVHPRQGPLRDGRLVFAPRSLARALDGLDAKGRRHVTLNQKMYGAALAVPLGTTTRVCGSGLALTEDLEALTLGRAEVVEIDPSTLEVVDREAREAAEAASQEVDGQNAGPETEPSQDTTASERPEPSTRTVVAPDPAETGARTVRPDDSGPDASGLVDDPAPQPRRSILGGIGTIVSRVAKGRAHDVDAAPEPDEQAAETSEAAAPAAQEGAPQTARPPAALRETRPALRAEATLPTLGSAALDPAVGDTATTAPEGRELRRPGSVDLVIEPVAADSRVRPISTLGDPVEPLVIDDYVTEPAYDPVIGPELTAARTRLGLSVDELAERTRIRPHVIESIEVDDFAPCGGDFYARGHLRTLARILGKDPAPLLATFEERYATAPVNARRIFEAELATGMTGSMRSTAGGPNWGLLVGVVLTLVLVWGVARLFTTDPVDMVEVPAPVLGGAATLDEPEAAPKAAPLPEPVKVRLTAAEADAEVVVRDGEGMVIFSGEMVMGERKMLQVTPPVRVRASDGGAVEARVAGRDRGLLGTPGEPARRTFR
ncbi:MAG TPA: helix-turn-helix domain-containing protein [Nocardioidaceae bacterium]